MDSDNATSAQPQTSQWGRLAEILGEVKTYIDVLEYSPKPSIETVATTLDVTEENALYQYQFNVLGAISTIKEQRDLCGACINWNLDAAEFRSSR